MVTRSQSSSGSLGLAWLDILISRVSAGKRLLLQVLVHQLHQQRRLLGLGGESEILSLRQSRLLRATLPPHRTCTMDCPRSRVFRHLRSAEVEGSLALAAELVLDQVLQRLHRQDRFLVDWTKPKLWRSTHILKRWRASAKIRAAISRLCSSTGTSDMFELREAPGIGKRTAKAWTTKHCSTRA